MINLQKKRLQLVSLLSYHLACIFSSLSHPKQGLLCWSLCLQLHGFWDKFYFLYPTYQTSTENSIGYLDFCTIYCNYEIIIIIKTTADFNIQSFVNSFTNITITWMRRRLFLVCLMILLFFAYMLDENIISCIYNKNKRVRKRIWLVFLIFIPHISSSKSDISRKSWVKSLLPRLTRVFCWKKVNRSRITNWFNPT